jgi:hypothetical protein
MKRILFSLPILALACAWAGAHTAPVGPETRVRMLEKNKVLMELLIDRGLELGETENLVDRVTVTRNATLALRDAVKGASDANETGRLPELANHLATVYADGLAVVLDAAVAGVPEGSPDYERLKAVRNQILSDAIGVDALRLPEAEAKRVVEAAGKVQSAAKGK